MVKVLNKQLNAVKTGFSFLFSSVISKPAMSGMPLAVGIEPTNHCNLHCPECASGSGILKREKGFMDKELYSKIITELHPYIFYINLFFQGEPMIHPDFFWFINQTSDSYLVVSTNGHFLSPDNSTKIAASKLNKLIVSIDGMDQNTYSHYRKDGKLSIVMTGIKNVSEAIKIHNSDLILELQFLVNRTNEHQIDSVRLFAKDVKARLRLKSMQIISNNNIEQWLPVQDKYRRYKEDKGSFVIRNPMPKRCFRLWTNPVITWDGKVLPCCFDKDANHIMGDLHNNTFREIWFGEKYREFRQLIITKRCSIDICKNCTSGLRGVKT
jgi:radical SAM protein with 4Fe4S-binding SPASM domain